MAKQTYYYNPKSLRYEKIEASWQSRLWQLFTFICAGTVFAFIILVLAYNFLDSPKEKRLKSEISKLKDQYRLLDKDLEQMSEVLNGLRYRDANIYRVLFESEPIPGEVWEASVGGSNRFKELANYANAELMTDVSKKVDKLERQLYIQSKSYDDVNKMIKDKSKMLAAIPSIQPISNSDLTRISSGYGMRTDPVYKIKKFHAGMDFTAQTGTEIYSTGDGKVEKVNYSKGGYGNQVIINHGYGYKTRYAHMSKFAVYPGQKVKRGEVIGYVGNTGKSVGPHLHYEVIKDDSHVDPVFFFYNDLDEEEFEKMLEISANTGQSLD